MTPSVIFYISFRSIIIITQEIENQPVLRLASLSTYLLGGKNKEQHPVNKNITLKKP